jgi:hypothetical protein
MTKTRSRLTAAAAATLALALPAVGASPAEAALKRCSPGAYPGQGYFTSLKVEKISCSGGRDVMRAHYRCRTQNGRKGRCSSFSGWRCTESRQASSTLYNALVVCKKSGRTVRYTYSQDT